MLRKFMSSSVFVLGALTGLPLAVSAAEEATKQQGSQLIEVKEKNFSLEVPSDWVKDKPREGLDLFIYAPVPAGEKVALTNIGVVAGKVSRDLSLANFYKVNVDNLPKAFENFNEIASGTGGIPKESTNWIHFTRTLKTEAGEISLDELQYYLIAGEYGYVITFSATPNEYLQNRGIFERVVGTFKILPFTPVLQTAPSEAPAVTVPEVK